MLAALIYNASTNDVRVYVTFFVPIPGLRKGCWRI